MVNVLEKFSRFEIYDQIQDCLLQDLLTVSDQFWISGIKSFRIFERESMQTHLHPSSSSTETHKHVCTYTREHAILFTYLFSCTLFIVYSILYSYSL